MLELHTASSPVVFAMLAVCILGMGFMIRFLSALAVDGRKSPAGRSIRLKLVNRPPNVVRSEQTLDEAAMAALFSGQLRRIG